MCTANRVNAPPPTGCLGRSMPRRIQDEADAVGVGGVGHVIGQPADTGRRAASNRQIEDLFRDLGGAVEQRSAAGEDKAGVERLFVARFADLVPHQMEDLFGARLKDVGQDAPRHDPRPPAADAGHLDGLVFLDHRRERAAAAPLDLLGFRNRRAQADGDVVGEVIATDGDDGGVPHAAALEDGEVGGSAADVEQRDAQLFLVRGQHRLGRRELADHRIDHFDAGPVDASHEVLRRRLAAGDDVHVDLEPGAGEADRRTDALLLVDDEILRQHVEDLAADRQRHRARRVDGAPHVVARHFPVLAGDRDDTAAVEALDVRAAEPEVDRADLDAGHQLGFFDRPLDRFDRGVEVDDDAALEPFRLGDAEPDHVDAALFAQLADDRADLRGPDVESYDVALVSSQHVLLPPPSVHSPGPSGPR